MANIFQNTSLVARTALAMFENNFPALMLLNRTYQGEFLQGPYKKGDTFQIRRQTFFNGGEGATITTEDVIETTESLVIEKQFNVAFKVSSKEATLNLENFAQEVLRPAVQRLITKCETYIYDKAETSLYFFTGSASSDLNSYSSVSQAGVKLLEQGVDLNDNAYFNCTVKDADAIKAASLTQFTPVINDNIYKTARVGHISYFDVFWSQLIKQHTAGAGPTLHPGDSLTVNGAVSSGNTIILAGATASVTNYFLPGDVISIAGVQNVNPVARDRSTRNAQFVITAAANSSGGGAVTITVAPSIISDSTSPLQNVTNAVPNGAVVTMVGTHNINLAFTRRSGDIVCPPMEKLMTQYCSNVTDEKTGIALRLAGQGDITNDVNIFRLDILIGSIWHPQYASKVLSRVLTT